MPIKKKPEEGVVEREGLRAVEEEGGFVEDLDGLVDVAVVAVGLDDGGDGGGGEGETVVEGDLADEGPHGLVGVGAGEGGDDLFEFEGVWRVGGVGSCPVEEAERLSGIVGTRAKDTEDELGGYGDAELVEGAFQVEVAPHDVRHVVDYCEVLVAGGRRGG